MALSHDVIDQMIPLLLDRMKNGTRSRSQPITPGSSSPTISSTSAASPDDVKSPVTATRTSNLSCTDALTHVKPALSSNDEGSTDTLDDAWVNITTGDTELNKVADDVHTPTVSGSSLIGPGLPPSDNTTQEDFELVDETADTDPVTTPDQAGKG